ncbi:MAG: hypothetical protein CMF30_00235 [Kiritimatiellaceae bacterium]|nr:hypothetical protein [Kiritimatiellaceae bacterium]
MVRYSLFTRKKIIFVLILVILFFTALNIKFSKKNYALDIVKINQILLENDNQSAFLNEASEKSLINKFTNLYKDYTSTNIEKYVDDLYDQNVYFIDPVHQIGGLNNVKEYFYLMTKPIESCRFEINSISKDLNNYFVRWDMYLISKASPNKKIVTTGITHFIVNSSEKIIFHQDFWDLSSLYDELPVISFWSKLVKERMLGKLNEK